MAVTIQVISGSGQSAFTDTQFDNPIRIRLLDGGSPLAFTSVEFGVPDQGWPSGTWSGGTQYIYVDTDNSGYANSQSFRANGLQGSWYGMVNAVGASQVTFIATNLVRTPAEATSLVITAGNSQSRASGVVFSPNFAVRVYDQYGAQYTGGSVSFSVPSGYGTFANGLTSVTVTASGSTFTATAFTAGATLGTFNVTATANGHSVLFTETVSAPTMPTECTIPVPPGGAINFGSGVNGIDWVNPTLALAGGGGASYATSTQTGAGNISKQLLFTPKPTYWGWMDPNAIIVDLVFWCYARGAPGAGTLGNLQISFLKNGAFFLVTRTTFPGWGVNSFVQIGYQMILPVPPALNNMKGSDLSIANTGFGLSNAPVAGTLAGTGFNINGAVMRVCFKDPYSVAKTYRNVPLLFCEG